MATNPLDLTGSRIVVTGAASGIGREIASLVSRLGARVVLVDRNETGLTETRALLTGDDHDTHACDLRDVRAIPTWMTDVARGGLLNGVVHAAGIPSISPVRLLDEEAYRDVLRVNTEAALALVRGFQRPKVGVSGGGSIVFISSVMALVGSPGAAAYSLSKAALIGLARSVAIELAPRKIRVNCIAPGFVRTPMLDKVGGMWNEQQFAQVEAQHPLGLGDPIDVANAAAFLLAPTARWITGSVLTVDGGYTAQ